MIKEKKFFIWDRKFGGAEGWAYSLDELRSSKENIDSAGKNHFIFSNEPDYIITKNQYDNSDKSNFYWFRKFKKQLVNL